MNPRAALSRAIAMHDLATMRDLLEAGASADDCMREALGHAFENGADAVALLVAYGASPGSDEADFATTPLMHLAGAGELARVEALLGRGADAAVTDFEGRTALDWALDGGSWRVAQRLAATGAPYRGASLDRSEMARRCALGAARHARLEDLRAALAAAPAPLHDRAFVVELWTLASGSERSDFAVPPPSEADRAALIEVAEEHAAAADPTAPPWSDADRARVIAGQVGAVHAGDLFLVRMVASRLAPLTPDEHGRLLAAAAGVAAEAIVEMLLDDHEAGPEALGAGLLAAAERGSDGFIGRDGVLPIVRRLLADGAPVDARGPGAVTPLMRASHGHDVSIMKLLLAKGADVAARDERGRTAMAYANHLPEWPTRDRFAAAVALLRNRGAAPQAWSDDDRPAARLGPPGLREKLSFALFIFCAVTIGFGLFVLRCVE